MINTTVTTRVIVTMRVTRVLDGQLLRNVQITYAEALSFFLRNEDNESITITIQE